MVTIDNETKERLSQFIDPNGRLVISEDMPSDLKAAISFLNSNNINIFSENDPLADMPEDDETEDLFDDENLEIENESNSVVESNIDYLKNEDDNIDLTDLEDLV